MSNSNNNLRGVLLMVVAMAAFVTNDTLIKMATERMPAFETLFFRSIFAMGWGTALMAATGGLRHVRRVLDNRVMFRNAMELVAVAGFIIGLANVSIADMTALSQLAPVLVALGAVIVLKVPVTRLQIGLSLVACVGAVMVAQPGTDGFSVFALFGVWNAVIIAIRELGGRSVSADIPSSVVAFGSAAVVFVGAGALGLIFEQWVWPDLDGLLLIAGAGFFLILAHFTVFTSYRIAEPGLVAPFSYVGTIFALISSLVVFGTLPNGLALAGIAVILTCGVLLMVSEGRKSRRTRLEQAVDRAVP